MASLIQLTQYKGDPIWFNVDYIVCVNSVHDGGAFVGLKGMAGKVVTESPAEIAVKIREAQK